MSIPKKKEFEIEKKENITNYLIPSGGISLNKTIRYYRNIFFLLYPEIECNKLNDKDELIFHFNFYQELPLLEMLKQYYPHCKMVYTVHYMEWCFTIKGNRSYLKRIINNVDEKMNDDEKRVSETFKMEKNLYDIADKIVCLAEFTRSVLMEDYQIEEKKISLIYNGLKDEAKILTPEEKNKLKNKFHINENEKTVLFVGRLDEVKRADIVIRAFKSVIQQSTLNCKLIIVGDGDYSTYLKECRNIWSKVIFTGHIDKKTLYEIYQIADLGIMPSTHEQCSYVAIEMLAHGIPLIASTTTGLKEMIPPELEPFKLEITEKEKDVEISVDDCAEKILKILSLESKEWEKLSISSRKFFLEKYSIYKMKQLLLKLY